MALLASPDVGVRGCPLLKNRSAVTNACFALRAERATLQSLPGPLLGLLFP